MKSEDKIGSIDDRIKEYIRGSKAVSGFKFWEREQKTCLTLSVKIHEQEGEAIAKIKDLQERIADNLKNIKIINDPYDNRKSGLFKYPEDRIHFSLINFLIDYNDFDAFKVKTNSSEEYKKLRKQITSLIKENKPKIANVKIGFLWHGDGKKIDSFSLQIFPEEDFIYELISIVDKIRENTDIPEKIRDLGFEEDIKVKGIPPYPNKNDEKTKRFSTNILRFLNFRNKKDLEEILNSEKEALIKKSNKINKEYMRDNNFIDLKIEKIFLLESDPFLFKWNKIREFSLNN